MLDYEKNQGFSNHLEDALIRLTNQQLYLGESVNAMTLKINKLLQRVSPALSPTPSMPTPLPPPQPAPASTHHMKLDVPRFDGTEPLGWFFTINQFF